MAVAEVTNLVIEKGTHFSVVFNLYNDDSSGANLSGLTTAKATIRKHPTSTVFEEFEVNIIATPPGIINLSLTDTQTNNLETGRNYFDVLIYVTEDGETTRDKFIKGTAIVEESMTA